MRLVHQCMIGVANLVIISLSDDRADIAACREPQLASRQVSLACYISIGGWWEWGEGCGLAINAVQIETLTMSLSSHKLLRPAARHQRHSLGCKHPCDLLVLSEYFTMLHWSACTSIEYCTMLHWTSWASEASLNEVQTSVWFADPLRSLTTATALMPYNL